LTSELLIADLLTADLLIADSNFSDLELLLNHLEHSEALSRNEH